MVDENDETPDEPQGGPWHREVIEQLKDIHYTLVKILDEVKRPV